MKPVVALVSSHPDLGVEHQHSGAGGLLPRDHRHQQHHRHQVHRVCSQRQVRTRRRRRASALARRRPLSRSALLSPRSCFLINTADRIIRVYDGREILTCGRDGEPEPMQKLQDLVNRSDHAGRTDAVPLRPPPPPPTLRSCWGGHVPGWPACSQGCALSSGPPGSAAASQVMVNTSWLARPGSTLSTSGKRASGTW